MSPCGRLDSLNVVDTLLTEFPTFLAGLTTLSMVNQLLHIGLLSSTLKAVLTDELTQFLHGGF